MSYRLLSSGAPWPERKRCCPSVRRPPAAGRTAPFRAFIACVALLGCQSPAPDPDDASAVPDTALRLDAISPLAGPSGGGIPLILRGQNIAPGAEVRVAGAIAPNAIFRSPGELRVTLPAGPGVIGPVPIELRNPDGQTTIRPELFAYGSLLEKPLGGQPASLASADFDGDGQYDLATLSLWDDSVTVLLNTGGGRFERQLRLPLGEHIEETASLAAVDLDGDGKSDLVVSQSARLFHNLGGGRFAAPVPLQAGVASQFVTVGDYDGDGRPDLALLNAHSSTGWILLNQGSLRFSTPIALTLGPIVYGEAVAAGDVNGDYETSYITLCRSKKHAFPDRSAG